MQRDAQDNSVDRLLSTLQPRRFTFCNRKRDAAVRWQQENLETPEGFRQPAVNILCRAERRWPPVQNWYPIRVALNCVFTGDHTVANGEHRMRGPHNSDLVRVASWVTCSAPYGATGTQSMRAKNNSNPLLGSPCWCSSRRFCGGPGEPNMVSTLTLPGGQLNKQPGRISSASCGRGTPCMLADLPNNLNAPLGSPYRWFSALPLQRNRRTTAMDRSNNSSPFIGPPRWRSSRCFCSEHGERRVRNKLTTTSTDHKIAARGRSATSRRTAGVGRDLRNPNRVARSYELALAAGHGITVPRAFLTP